MDTGNAYLEAKTKRKGVL